MQELRLDAKQASVSNAICFGTFLCDRKMQSCRTAWFWTASVHKLALHHGCLVFCQDDILITIYNVAYILCFKKGASAITQKPHDALSQLKSCQWTVGLRLIIAYEKACNSWVTSQVAKELSKMASLDTPYITFYERFVVNHLYCAPFARQCHLFLIIYQN